MLKIIHLLELTSQNTDLERSICISVRNINASACMLDLANFFDIEVIVILCQFGNKSTRIPELHTFHRVSRLSTMFHVIHFFFFKYSIVTNRLILRKKNVKVLLIIE